METISPDVGSPYGVANPRSSAGYAPSTGVTYGYIDNSGKIQQSTVPVNTQPNGDVYQTTDGTIVSGPNTGGQIDITTGNYISGAKAGGNSIAPSTAFNIPGSTFLLVLAILLGAGLLVWWFLL